MSLGQSPLQTWTYVLPQDRGLPAEQQTVWHIRHLTAEEEMSLVHFNPEGAPPGQKGSHGHTMYLTLKWGLVGADRARDEKGDEFKFEVGTDGKVTDAFLLRVKLVDRLFIAGAIQNEVAITPTELGKSEPLST